LNYTRRKLKAIPFLHGTAFRIILQR